MFGSLNTNMRSVIECVEPLDPIVRAQVEGDAADDSEVVHSQIDAIRSNIRQALRSLYDSALDELKLKFPRSGRRSELDVVDSARRVVQM